MGDILYCNSGVRTVAALTATLSANIHNLQCKLLIAQVTEPCSLGMLPRNFASGMVLVQG